MPAAISPKSGPVATDAGQTSAEPVHQPPLRTRLPGNQALLRVQRQCACGGTCSNCRGDWTLQKQSSAWANPARTVRPTIQTKIPVGPVDDPLEREADQVASRIIRSPHAEPPSENVPSASESTIQRSTAEEFEEDTTPIRRKASDLTAEPGPAAASFTAANLTQGGSPLPKTVQAFFEPRFGRDFSDVRIHTGKDSEEANFALRSNAFTYGNHIWMGRGQKVGANPLLAHELTHVVQQTRPPAADAAPRGGIPPTEVPQQQQSSEEIEPAELPRLIQREPTPLPPASNIVRSDFGNGFVLVQTPALGRGTLYYQDRIWVNFKWDPAKGPDERKLAIDLKVDSTSPVPRLTLKIDVNFRLQLQVNQATEQFMADVATASLMNHGGRMEVAIEANGSGEMNTFPAKGGPSVSEPLPAKTLTSYAPTPGAMQEPIFPRGEGEIDEPRTPPTAPNQPGDILTTQQQVWIQPDQTAFEEFAKNHPDTNWAAVTLPDGRVVAFALTEGVLQDAASRIREQDYRLPFQSPFPGSHVTVIVIRGKVLSSLNDLENLYYRDDLSAAVGNQTADDYEEAEVFEMAQKSFGRKPLTHDQAVARWAELDAMSEDKLLKLETEPGRKFSMLRVRGKASSHYLDVLHFQSRIALLALPKVTPGFILDASDPRMRVLEAEADRETISGPIRTFLENNSPTAEALQEKVVHDIESYAHTLAVRSLQQGLEPFQKIVSSDAHAAIFLTTLASAPTDERRRMLLALGYGKLAGGVSLPIISPHVPQSVGNAIGTQIVLNEEFKKAERVTGNRDNVLRLMLGETIEDTSLKSIRYRASDTASQFQKTIDSLGSADKPKVKMLYHDGDLGKTVRALTYRAMGFDLKPEDYPHRGQTKGLFPDAMSGGTFVSISEQLYANHSARHASIEDLKLAAEIVAAIIITIISEGLAAELVASVAFFRGSMAARTVISALTFTTLETAFQSVLNQKNPFEDGAGTAAGKFASQFAMNLAMFAFFKQLDSVFAAFSKRGVGALMGLSEEAFAANRLAQGAANAGRLSGLSAVFTTIAFDQFIIANGRPPNAREAARMAIQSVASIASMEVAGSLVKSMSSEGGFWGRANMLDVGATERQAMLDRIRGVNKDLIDTKLNPDQLNAKAPDLANRYESILNDQKKLVKDLQPEMAKKDDATTVNNEAAAELARIDASLDALHQAKLVSKAQISPAGDPANAAQATEFTYKDTPETRQAIVDQFGASKTKIGSDGVITVARGDGAQITIRPVAEAPAAKATEPAPGKDPQAPADKAETKKTEPQDEPQGKKDQDLAGGQAKAEQKGPAPADPAQSGDTSANLDFFTRREALVERHSSLLRRARASGLMDEIPEFGPGSARGRQMNKAEMDQRVAAQNAVRGVQGRQPRRLSTEKGLAQQEADMARAEKAAKPELDRLADLAFARHKERLEKAGLSLDNVRTGKLSNLTDRQVGEALAEVPGAQGLNEAQLRGILFARYGKGAGEPINIQRVFDMSASAAERNAVLEWFANLMEQGVPGTYEVLQTMTVNRNNWRGGMHVLDFAVNGTGGVKVDRFEFPEAVSDTGDMRAEGGRIYDILLADGTRIQGKNWRNWFDVTSQFRRDVLIMTGKFSRPDGVAKVRWVFRSPSPRPAADIRNIMRETLEATMNEPQFSNLTAEQKATIRSAFEAHTDLVQVWGGTALPGTAAPPAAGAATAP